MIGMIRCYYPLDNRRELFLILLYSSVYLENHLLLCLLIITRSANLHSRPR